MDPVAIARALAAEGVATLPETGVATAAVHAVYAAWLQGRPWAPLVMLDARHTRTAAEAIAGAVGGLVYAGRGVPRTNLLPAVRARGGVLLLQGDEPSAWAGAPLVPAATDPSTTRLRAVLAAYAGSGEVAMVTGPLGSGRASLAGVAVPEAAVVRDLEELDPVALASLAARLEPRQAAAPSRPGHRPEHAALGGLVGTDARFCAVLEEAIRVAPAEVPVLVLGETGAGKEPLARLLHDASGRRGPFIAVDLASRSPTLVDDDLFGHVPGAFEGARTPRDGAVRRAHRGTLFLDELGNLSPALQLKLLRVLERKEVQPIGTDVVTPVDVRIVAATNADLDGMVRVGTFRADLYHRLAGVILRLPPLRDRGDDVLLLAEHFATEAGARLLPDARVALRARVWPGNVRELRRTIEAAAARKRPIDAEAVAMHLPALVVTGSGDLSRLPRRAALVLHGLQITLAAPADRGAACLQNAVSFGLAGRPVTADALDQLLAAPWWGNFHEVERKLAALRAGPPGPIDAAALGALFPIDVAPREPIVTLLHPTLREDGGVSGFSQAHAAGALVIGRAGRRGECGPRGEWLARQVGDASLAFAAFPSLPELSRVHVLVRRSADGLVVEVPPGVPLAVEVRSLDGDPVALGGPVGAGAHLRVLRGEEPYLELWVLCGEGLLAGVARGLAARGRRLLEETQRAGVGKRAWTVEQAEIELLVPVVVAFVRGEGDFAAALRTALVPRADFPELRAYLITANPAQSFARLLNHPGNTDLRDALHAALTEAGLPDRAQVRLPALVRAALGPPRLLRSLGERAR